MYVGCQLDYLPTYLLYLLHGYRTNYYYEYYYDYYYYIYIQSIVRSVAGAADGLPKWHIICM